MGAAEYVEVVGEQSGQVWRFAAGTKAGFAARRIQGKLGAGAQQVQCIAAVHQASEQEPPVEFGPDAELVCYGKDWKLMLVQEATPSEVGAWENLYPGGKLPRGGKAELSSEYIGKVLLTFVLVFMFGAGLKLCLEWLPPV